MTREDLTFLTELDPTVLDLLVACARELSSAQANNEAFHSAHEGYAVLLEEVEELKAWVWRKRQDRAASAMSKECIQVAAMAIRFIVDVCMKPQCHYFPKEQWCDRYGPGGFMGHVCGYMGWKRR